MRKIVKYIFRKLGFEIKRKKSSPSANALFQSTMAGGLQRWSEKMKINTILDVGAAQGTWSLGARKYWPDASYVLFEPLEERREELLQIAQKLPNFFIVSKAVGREEGKQRFYVSSDLDGSGLANEKVNEANTREVLITTLDSEIEALKLKGPYMVKLDTHGFEIPILEGCRRILPNVDLFIIESYGFQIADKSLLLWEMCSYMDKLGFRLVDLVDVMYRPVDKVFWQCDAFFIKKDNPLFEYNKYR